MQKITASLLTLTLLVFGVSTSFAKQKADWNAVKNSVNQEIAVKTVNGKTSFGILRAADDNEIKIQPAEKKALAGREMIVRRHEIEKIWRASLRYGGRAIGKGALIGAGIGAGVGLIGGATAKEPDPLNYAGVALFGIAGAGIGAMIGALSKKGHRKNDLIYAI